MAIKVKQPEKPVSTEILAEAIVRIGQSFVDLQRNGLNKKAIVILIQAETKLSQRDVITVLDALPRLRGWYCR